MSLEGYSPWSHRVGHDWVTNTHTGGSSSKESTCQCRRRRRHGLNPWGGKILLEDEMATHSSILAWEVHGQRSLVGCNPRSHKELDKTEHTHLLYYFKCIVTYVMKKTQLNIFAIHFHWINILLLPYICFTQSGLKTTSHHCHCFQWKGDRLE